MNTLIELISRTPVDSLADVDIETVFVTEEPVVVSRNATVDLPWQHSTLNGYDALMRRHAAACEAGR
jgi:hypothetical protein